MPQRGFKPATPPASSLAAATRQYTAAINTASAYGNTIEFVHLVAAGDRITEFAFDCSAATEGTPGTLTVAAYLTNAAGSTQGARVGSAATITTSSATPAYYKVAVDIDLTPWIGQYIKISGGYANLLRRYYVTCTSGESVSVDSNAPTPFGTATARTNMMAMYMTIITAQQLLSVNGGAGLAAGSTGNTAVVDGFSSNPISGSIGPLAFTSFSYDAGTETCTFNIPAYSDGATWPPLDGTATAIVSDGTLSASLSNVPTNPPTGWAQVTFQFPITDDDTFLGYYTELNGYEAAYPTSGNTLLSQTGGFTTDSPITFTMFKRNISTGLMTELNVTLDESGSVIEATGVISKEIIARGITSKKITARSL